MGPMRIGGTAYLTLLAGGLLLLSGCAGPMQWVKADVSAEQARLDAEQCHQEAWHEAHFRSWRFPSQSWGRRGRGMGAFANDPFFEESRLADFCMRVRGYQLVPLNPPAG
jgi:hypothetical protein